MRNYQKQRGFTLIELVMVIVILGILAATALPRFVNLSGEAQTAAEAGMSGGVKSAHSILVAQRAAQNVTPINPDVTTLAAAITPAGTAVATGVQVTINGVAAIVPTFTDATCTTPTAAVGNQVLCVGDI